MRKFLLLTLVCFSFGLYGLKSQDLTFIVPVIETCETSVCVPITVENFNGIWAFSYTMEWDETILRFDSLGGFNLPNMSNSSFGTGSAVSSGFYTAAWTIAAPPGVVRADGDTIYNVYFTILGNTGDSSIVKFNNTPTDIIAGDPTLIPVDTISGVVKIGDWVSPDLECPDNVVINTPNPSETINTGLEPKTLDDNCDPSVDLSYTSTGATTLSGMGNANGETFNAMPNNGITTVTYTAEDDMGNMSTCNFTVTINQVSDSLMIFTVSDTAFCDDTDIRIDFDVFNFTNLSGLQFSIVWDKDVLGFNTVTNFNLAYLDINSFGLTQTGDGILTFSWIDNDLLGKTVPDGDSIFTVVFNVVGNPGEESLIDVTDVPTDYFAAQGPGFLPYPVDDEDMYNGKGVIVDDPPVITCPSNISVNVDPGTCGTVVTWSDPAVTDDCDMPAPSPVQIDGQLKGSIFPAGVDTIKYMATDSKMQSDTCSFTVAVIDNEAPVPDIANLPNATGECSVTAVAPTATDNCEGTITGTTTDPLTYSTQGTFTITWTYDDGNGNTSTQMQTVIVDDVTAPVANVSPLPNVTGECSATVTGAPTATDNCEGAITGTTTDPLTYSTQGTFIVTWTYDDGNGNTSSQTQSVVVDDVTAPVPDVATLPDVTGECSATVTGTPTATDNCEGAIVGTTTDPLTYSTQGTFTVTWSFDDGNGNISTQTQTVIVDDVTAPVPDAASLPDVTDECSTTVVSAPTATDNCEGAITGTTTDPLTYSSQGTFTITWTFDDGNGNTSTQTQTVILDDITAPVPDVAPLPDVTGECSATATAPTATDNCEGTITGTTTDPLTYSTQGTFTITWTYDDGNGNTSTQMQTVIVDDVTAPVANVFPLPDVTGECSATATAPTATDNCEGTIIGTTTDPLTYSTQGTFTITWTYDDGNGNTSMQMQTVIVDDVTAPVSDVAILPDVTGECSTTVTGAPTATDNCEGTITGTTTDPLTYTTQGTFTITWTYNDGNGNTSTQTQTVIIDDVTAPVQDVATLPNVTGECSATATAPTATDNCEGTITGTTTDPLTYTTQGTFTITWTYNDGNGNTSTQTQTVIVDDITAPVPNVAPLPNLTGACSVTAVPPTATDNCAGLITATTTDPLVYNTQGSFAINWIYNDGNGNMITQTQIIIIDDVTAPVPDVANLPNVTGECSATVTPPTATDNCIGVVTGTTTDPLTYSTQGTFTITWIYDDGNGNTSTQMQTVIVDDVTAPVPDVATLPDVTGECSATATAPTATDNCLGTITGTTIDPLTYTTQGTFTITWNYDDGNGNTSAQMQTVIVDDVTAPSITCPTNQTVMIDVDCQASIDDYTSMATVSDNCSAVANISITQAPASGTVVSADTDIVLTATDEVGNSTDCTFKVILNDTEIPVITCPLTVTPLTADNNCLATLPNYASEVTATDNCPGLTVVQMPPIGTVISADTTTVIYTATDAAGNSASCSFEVELIDNTAPVLVQCVPDTFLIVNANCQAVLPDFTTLVVFEDNCTDVNDLKITQIPPAGSMITNDTVVAVVALDSVGIISDTCFFLVELRDTTPPTITCPTSINTNTGANNCGTTVSWPMPATADNCGVDTVFCNPVLGTFFPVGDSTITCTVIDFEGNTNTCQFTVTVNDGIPPFLDCPSDTVILVATGIMDTMIFNIGLDSLSDNCMVDTLYHKLSGAMTGGGDGDASGTSFVVGTTTVTYFAEDPTGNIDSCSFNVIVLEAIIIDLDCPADYSVPTDDGACSAIVDTDAPGIDPLAGLDTIYYELTNATTGSGPDSVPDNQVFNTGTTTVTYTAVSITNDTSICSFTVTVADQMPPSITCPSTITIVDNTTDSCGVVFGANLQMATATDNCPGVQISYNIVTGGLLPVGTNIITATATDGANLTTSCTYQLTVRDVQPPLIAPCPANITVNNDPGLCGAAVQRSVDRRDGHVHRA